MQLKENLITARVVYNLATKSLFVIELAAPPGDRGWNNGDDTECGKCRAHDDV